jgi:hypothetical protein
MSIHVGSGGDDLVPKKSVHVFQFESRFFALGAHPVPKTVPADIQQTSFACNRFNVILEQLLEFTKKSDKYSEFSVFQRKSDEFCPNNAKFPSRGKELTANSVEI